MKKYLFLLLAVMTLFVLGACNNINNNDDDDEQEEQYTIALITDIGDIDDKSFNQGSWEGVLSYVEGKDVTYKYYKPTETTSDAYIAAIDLAVANGAEIVVTPGYMFADPINIAQNTHPDVKFVILDGNPAHVTDGTLEDNVYSVFYAEQQAGYLAGYAAVKEGYTKLGFMGGVAVPAVVRFGHGFVMGADAAAVELDVDIEIKYHYTGGFDANPTVQSTAAAMYNGGTEVIFACGGAVGQSVMAAAATVDKKVIGVDVDQSGDSDTVITSAMKELGSSVENALEKYFSGDWDTIGGQSVVLDASNGGIGLPMDTSTFETFTQAEYDAVYQDLADGTLTFVYEADNATDLTVSKTTVIPTDAPTE